ncbi:MAG TPA: hypothetical protein VKZ50_04450 [bacterium]|nr:hypothetical protein [bacterium]
MRRLVSLLVLVTCCAVPAGAQTQWLIIPGKSWGPIVLGETQEQVRTVLGAPQRQDEGQIASDWYYANATLVFNRRVSTNPTDVFQLWSIDIGDRSAVTREGVKIGTPLSLVLRTYGDTADNTRLGSVRDCLDVLIHADRSRGQPNYASTVTRLNYLDRGITFDLLASRTGEPTVVNIGVRPAGECRPLF